MKKKLLIIFLSILSINSYAQNFSNLSGTVRASCGWAGDAIIFGSVFTVWLTRLGFALDGDGTFSGWIRQNHNTYLRFFNIGYDVQIPQWSMTSTNHDIKLDRPYKHHSGLYDLFGGNNYIYYLGYYLNWKSPFSRFGFYAGADYEWRSFSLSYQPESDAVFRYSSNNDIQSIVPAAGIRYRLISPEREIDGFPINLVLEAGLSYAFVTKYADDCGYGIDAVNNGFRANVGISITTNKYGSIHVRWSKDLYNVYKKGYTTTEGFLSDNEIRNNFSSFSIGYASFF